MCSLLLALRLKLLVVFLDILNDLSILSAKKDTTLNETLYCIFFSVRILLEYLNSNKKKEQNCKNSEFMNSDDIPLCFFLLSLSL